MTFLRRSLTALFILFLSASTAMAQATQQNQPNAATPDSVTDKELKKFVDASNEAQSIQKNIQQEIQKVVTEEGMEFSRFQKIMMSQRNPQMGKNMEVSKEEQQTIQKIQPELREITKGAQQKIVKAIEDEGLTTKRYQEIVRALQMSPELANRMKEIQKQDSQ